MLRRRRYAVCEAQGFSSPSASAGYAAVCLSVPWGSFFLLLVCCRHTISLRFATRVFWRSLAQLCSSLCSTQCSLCRRWWRSKPEVLGKVFVSVSACEHLSLVLTFRFLHLQHGVLRLAAGFCVRVGGIRHPFPPGTDSVCTVPQSRSFQDAQGFRDVLLVPASSPVVPIFFRSSSILECTSLAHWIQLPSRLDSKADPTLALGTSLRHMGADTESLTGGQHCTPTSRFVGNDRVCLQAQHLGLRLTQRCLLRAGPCWVGPPGPLGPCPFWPSTWVTVQTMATSIRVLERTSQGGKGHRRDHVWVRVFHRALRRG